MLSVRQGIFNEAHSDYVALIATVLLQCVSFVTTLEGCRYFFAGIGVWAPFFVAGVIQLLILYISNSAFRKKIIHKGTIGLLILVGLISVIFSYIGIVNTIVDPKKEIKASYTAYYNAYNQSYDKLHSYLLLHSVNQKDMNTYLENEVDNMVSTEANANNKMKDLQDEITAAQAQVKNNQNVHENTSTTTTTNQQSGNVTVTQNSTDTTNDQQDTQNAINITNKNNAKISGLNSQLKIINQLMPTDQIKSKYTQSSFTDNLNDYYKNEADIDDTFWNDFFQLNDQFHKLDALVSGGQNAHTWTNKDAFISLTTVNSDFTALNSGALKLAAYHAFQPDDFSSNAQIITLINKIETEIQTKGSSLNKLIVTYKKDLGIGAVPADLKFTNPYIIAFTRFVSDKWMALYALILALLLDGLTVLIPLFIEKRKKSVIRLKEIKRICREEDLIGYIYNLYVLQYGISSDETGEKRSDAQPKDSFKEEISRYLHLFQLSPYTQKLGFSMRAERSAIEGIFDLLTTCLLQLNYLQIVTKKEEDILREDYFNQYQENVKYSNIAAQDAGEPEQEHDYENYVYLMKTKFVIWITNALPECL